MSAPNVLLGGIELLEIRFFELEESQLAFTAKLSGCFVPLWQFAHSALTIGAISSQLVLPWGLELPTWISFSSLPQRKEEL